MSEPTRDERVIWFERGKKEGRKELQEALRILLGLDDAPTVDGGSNG